MSHPPPPPPHTHKHTNTHPARYVPDGGLLALVKSKSARLADKTRKELRKIFELFDLKITAESNLRIVNFLDVTFDLNNGKFRPYRKANDDPLYINRYSNHPSSIIRQLYLHQLTSALHCFHQMSKHLRNLHLHTKTHLTIGIATSILILTTLDQHASYHSKHAEIGNVTSFGLTHAPFSMNVSTNIGRIYLII